MTFKNLDSLFKHIEKQVQDTMVNEVADAVKDNMAEAVQTSVYDAYNPMYYKRRMQNGGLIDKDNMEVAEIPNGIVVRDVAPLDNGRRDFSLDEIIVNGWGDQPFERDFYTVYIPPRKPQLHGVRTAPLPLENRSAKVHQHYPTY